MASKANKPKNQRLMVWVIIPLFSCALSSLISMVIGQVGNLFLSILGNPSTVLTVMIFIGLFVVSFGLSFFFTGWLRKRLLRPHKATG